MKLIDELRARRRELELSQDDVATKLGVATNMISAWECKKNRPRLDLLVAWGQVLGLRLKWEEADDQSNE
jgi:transcriptional regulator with XRE-family HTH domain